MKVLIIGGVAGGASTAARLRRLDETAEIIMFERGTHISFANCGIPYFVGDVIKEESKLLLMTPEKFRGLLNIEARIKSEVISINRAAKTVTVRDLVKNSEYEEHYDKLVLSPGAAPVRPRIPGIDNKNIYTIRTVEDGVAVKTVARAGMKAVVIGGGFIGIEMAENLAHLGLETTIVEMSDQVMGPLDREMAAKVHNHIRGKGLGLYLSDGVQSFEQGERVGINLQSGKSIDADIVIFAIGVRPETSLAVAAGLEIGKSRGILVNANLQTSDDDIYALGDAIEVRDAITNDAALIPLAGPANKQGRIVAENIVGINSKYEHTQGTAIAKVFDLTVATTGNNEKQLRAKNIAYDKVYTLGWSHAEYYPDPFQMTIKLLFVPDTGKILGAQAIGMEGVDKRIDVIATAIHFGSTTAELARLELTYAPPFGSAKDPVNVIGMIAENIRFGKTKIIQWHEIDLTDSSVLYVDVRSKTEFNLNTLKNAINIPYEELRSRLNELPRDKKIVVFCAKGQKGYFSNRILLQNGFANSYNLVGGLSVYNPMMTDLDSVRNPLPAMQKAATCPVPVQPVIAVEIDACGLQCPGPILKLAQELDKLAVGTTVSVRTTDPGFKSDVAAWCRSTNNTLVEISDKNRIIQACIKKGSGAPAEPAINNRNGKTMVVFSNDLDKAIASFIIANGAAATGKPVTMFFTFWGLSILRRKPAPATKKDLLGRMFGWMLPVGPAGLKLSQMNMLGMGTLMMKYVMKQKNVDTLPALIEQAKQQGVKIIACQMSLDVMGLKPEELIDGIEIGGVASYIEKAERSDMNLFI
ncbi:MAG: DsrE/DsrF/DrsH-like family protein [Negativicutes bacterium]|jgi:NADPH-dependent 2,4-dienoyl-CoA reductase/sulfur reductase-like enzyme/peroxiredoxin family protein/TusA-related sulfurtransferase/rhodanese-related sulfurtransferase